MTPLNISGHNGTISTMANDDKKPERRRHGRHAFIPAGVLIGLGIGLLAGFPGSGVLIGLGLGFLAAALMPPEEPSAAGEPSPSFMEGKNMVMLLLGAFMIVIGIGIVFAPPNFWIYAVPAFLILMGIWFVLRGFRGHS